MSQLNGQHLSDLFATVPLRGRQFFIVLYIEQLFNLYCQPTKNTAPVNLIWSESTQWLRSSDVRKIQGAIITPMGTPIMPPWAKDHDVAHVQAKAISIN